jgi:hypothetical protein
VLAAFTFGALLWPVGMWVARRMGPGEGPSGRATPLKS